MRGAIGALENLQATIVEPADIPTASEPWSVTVLLHEFKSTVNAYLASLGPSAPVRTLEDVLAFNRRSHRQALRYGQTLLMRSQRLTSGTLTEPEYLRARLRDIRNSRELGIDASIADHNLDALLFPGFSGCALSAQAGYPSVSVPTGLVDSPEGPKPFGVTVAGPTFSEPLLIRCAAALESELPPRKAPTLA